MQGIIPCVYHQIDYFRRCRKPTAPNSFISTSTFKQNETEKEFTQRALAGRILAIISSLVIK